MNAFLLATSVVYFLVLGVAFRLLCVFSNLMFNEVYFVFVVNVICDEWSLNWIVAQSQYAITQSGQKCFCFFREMLHSPVSFTG